MLLADGVAAEIPSSAANSRRMQARRTDLWPGKSLMQAAQGYRPKVPRDGMPMERTVVRQSTRQLLHRDIDQRSQQRGIVRTKRPRLQDVQTTPQPGYGRQIRASNAKQKAHPRLIWRRRPGDGEATTRGHRGTAVPRRRRTRRGKPSQRAIQAGSPCPRWPCRDSTPWRTA